MATWILRVMAHPTLASMFPGLCKLTTPRKSHMMFRGVFVYLKALFKDTK